MAIRVLISSLDDVVLSEQWLDQSLVTFGRSKSCHVELRHPEMSRRHFVIKFVDDAYVLVDEGSRHGVNVDGVEIPPHKNYSLQRENIVVVPGFSLKIFWDGQKPKLERTTVVARQLLDELLQGSIIPRECPSLRSKSGHYHFKFVEEKSTFVLGSLAGGDFVVSDRKIAKKHLSFARDINGISAIPAVGNEVFLNQVLLHDPAILNHGAVIKIGDIELIYSETESNQIKEVKEERKTLDDKPSEIVAKTLAFPEASVTKKNSFRAFDRVFLLAFIVAIAYASVVFFELI